MKNKIAAVIPAAGHGSLDGGKTSKLLAQVGGMPILARVVERIKQADIFRPIIVVLNHRFAKEISQMLSDYGHSDVKFAYQEERKGPANAVYCALPQLYHHNIENFIVVFGEMAMVNPNTVAEMAKCHVRTQEDFTFLAYPYDTQCTLNATLNKYAFLVPPYGYGCSVPTVFMYFGKAPIEGSLIFGSQYVFKREWFEQEYLVLKPHDKGDGYPEEYHLPSFVDSATLSSSSRMNAFFTSNPVEILGVNTPEDLALVQRLAAREAGVQA